VIIAYKVKYSVDKQVKDHFAVCVAELSGVIRGSVGADNDIAEQIRLRHKVWTFDLRKGQNVCWFFFPTILVIKAGHLVRINKHERKYYGWITTQAF
jgi:hypothetical protein